MSKHTPAPKNLRRMAEGGVAQPSAKDMAADALIRTAFGVGLDEINADAANRFPEGISAFPGEPDKANHFVGSELLTNRFGNYGAAVLGDAWEVVNSTGYDQRDIQANALGRSNAISQQNLQGKATPQDVAQFLAQQPTQSAQKFAQGGVARKALKKGTGGLSDPGPYLNQDVWNDPLFQAHMMALLAKEEQQGFGVRKKGALTLLSPSATSPSTLNDADLQMLLSTPELGKIPRFSKGGVAKTTPQTLAELIGEQAISMQDMESGNQTPAQTVKTSKPKGKITHKPKDDTNDLLDKLARVLFGGN